MTRGRNLFQRAAGARFEFLVMAGFAAFLFCQCCQAASSLPSFEATITIRSIILKLQLRIESYLILT